jgi:hypothetical protein
MNVPGSGRTGRQVKTEAMTHPKAELRAQSCKLGLVAKQVIRETEQSSHCGRKQATRNKKKKKAIQSRGDEEGNRNEQWKKMRHDGHDTLEECLRQERR